MIRTTLITLVTLSACAAPATDPHREVIVVRGTVGDEAPRPALTRVHLAKLGDRLRTQLRRDPGPYAVRVDFDDIPGEDVLENYFLQPHGDGCIGRIDRESLKDLLVREDVVRVQAIRG